jgi:hypothetical protein
MNTLNQILRLIFIIILSASIPLNLIAQSWTPLSSGTNGPIYAMTTYKNGLVVAGLFSKAGSVNANNIAIWDGTNWKNIGNGVNGLVLSLTVFDGELYAGGTFSKADGKQASRIAKWDGTAWKPVGNGMDSTNKYAVYDMKVFKGYLYVAGGFEGVIGVGGTQRIAKWDGIKWTGVGGGMDLAIGSLEVYNNNLYAMGPFTKSGGVTTNGIARWNDTIWKPVGSGFDYSAYSYLKTHGNSLYAGGEFKKINGMNASKLAWYNGNTWNAPTSTTNGPIYTFEWDNSNLIVGGRFMQAGGKKVSYISSWDGTNWSSIDNGMDSFVNEIIIFQSEVYAAGEFSKAGGKTVNHIAKLSNPTSIKVLANPNKIWLSPNPSKGLLTIQNIPANEIATIFIFDLNGKMVISTTADSQLNTITLNDLHNGMYFYHAITQDGEVVKGKFILEQ